MKKLEYFDKEGLYFVGDIHGEFEEFVYNIKRFKLENSAFVICGDIGMGFNKPNYYKDILNHFSKKLEKSNNHVFALRGNHDDPSYFKEINEYGNFILLPDFTVISINLLNILVVGGGISIDRTERILDRSYWKNEMNNFDLDKLIKIDKKIDIVASHDAPEGCTPILKNGVKYWINRDKNLSKDIDESRRRLSKVKYYLQGNGHKILDWYYGHHHFNNDEKIEDIFFHLVGIMEFKEKRIK